VDLARRARRVQPAREGAVVVPVGKVERGRHHEHQHGGDCRQDTNVPLRWVHDGKHRDFKPGCQATPHRGDSLPATRAMATQVRGSSRERYALTTVHRRNTSVNAIPGFDSPP
jgi:hypothetical protein